VQLDTVGADLVGGLDLVEVGVDEQRHDHVAVFEVLDHASDGVRAAR